MKIKIILAFVLLSNLMLRAQTKGIVKDSITGQPIPYVSIWVENENIGITSEENGTFEINTDEKSKNLIFSSLGFQSKKVAVSKAAAVYLKPVALELDEVVLQNRKQTRTKEIGATDSSILEAFDNGPRIDVKFFAYSPEYKKTKYIKQLAINTDSKIENASVKIHFYGVDANGFPGAELLARDYIVTVGKGYKQTIFDVSKFGLAMPKSGIFVGFEKLMIESNKTEITIIDKATKEPRIKKSYYPMVLYNWVERDFTFTFSGGKWNRHTQSNNASPTEKMKIYEPAINLILTN